MSLCIEREEKKERMIKAKDCEMLLFTFMPQNLLSDNRPFKALKQEKELVNQNSYGTNKLRTIGCSTSLTIDSNDKGMFLTQLKLRVINHNPS